MTLTSKAPLNLSRDELSILDGLAARRGAMTDTLFAWSLINSGSKNRAGLDEMRAVLSAHFSALPGKLTEPPLAKGQSVSETGEIEEAAYAPAMCLTVRPDAPVQLVLTGHYDTVFPKDSTFQRPVLRDNDTANGPGLADMKGGMLVMFEALMAFERSAQAAELGYKVLLSPDEEIGSPGSAPLLADLGRQAHLGLTYEPALADGSLAGARKGSGNFTLIVRGRAAHAGREHHLGRNAMTSLARFTLALDALNGQREGVTFNMAKIDGGGAVNIVPDLAIGRFNVRMKETQDMKWIEEQLAKLTAELNASDGITAELTGGFTRPPKPMAPANRTVFNWVKKAGSALGQSISWAPSGGVCEGNNLWASGCPNVDTLGVRGGDIHSHNEYIILPSLTERAQLSALILMKIASGEFDARAVKAAARAQLTAASI